MLHTMFQDHRTSGSGEDFGHVTKTIFTKCMFLLPKEDSHKVWL